MTHPRSVHLGFEIGTGKAVEVPLRHMVVTGQTQEAGKTTTLEALISRSGVKAVAFVTKRGEGSFADARVIPPYFREQADWQFVASILEASRGEKLKFERAWIIRASKGARTLADVQRNVRKALETAKGLSADVYLTLDAYLEAVVPQIDRVRWATRVDLGPGVNAMDLVGLNVEMQHLVIRSTIDWVLSHAEDTVVVVPEAWKFIPQGRGTPVKLAAEAYIRQAAGLRNYLWLDSQDIAGVEKMILKSVPVWVLGVQRESNEVKRTLAQIPAGIKKPTADAVATLGLGEFYVCHGTHVTRVYVQPQWMSAADAIAVAQGQKDAWSRTARLVTSRQRQEAQVDEHEARQLREENTELRRQNADLQRRLEQLEANDSIPRAVAAVAAQPTLAEPSRHGSDEVSEILGDRLYQTIKTRLMDEAPALLVVLAQRPEIRVEVQRHTITADGRSLRGRIARLIADDFFLKARTSAEVLDEIVKRGADRPSNIELGTEMKALCDMGFFTRENKWYTLVPGMQARVVEVSR